MRLQITLSCAALLLLTACYHTYAKSEDKAPTPSSYVIESEALKKITASAESGNVADMVELSLYYSQEKGDDEAAFYWLVRAADAGSKTEQKAVLQTLEASDDRKNRAMAKFLKYKWKV
jgi:TPR repeat protein